jgi:hypothetical protein
MLATNKTSAAFKFVLMIGALSFFADFTYEGSRSILGPYLALLQASGTAVAVVTGFGAGFADFPLIAYHFQQRTSVPKDLVPVAYAIAMGGSGTGSLIFGRIFDRSGILILVPLTVLSALFAPLVFLGGSWPALLGAALWGLGMGVHESIIPAAVAPMVPNSVADLRLRPLHSWVWYILVHRKRADWLPLRSVDFRGSRIWHRRRIGCNPVFHFGSASNRSAREPRVVTCHGLTSQIY